MKTTITQDHYRLLYALFQVSALMDTLDDMDSNNYFVHKFKKSTNTYKKQMYSTAMKVLDQQYELDAEVFEGLDRIITQEAKVFADKGLQAYFTTNENE